MNNFLLGQPWALKLVWAVNVQNYTILPGTLTAALSGTAVPARPAAYGVAVAVATVASRSRKRRCVTRLTHFFEQ
jgi:hypothetical protein